MYRIGTEKLFTSKEVEIFKCEHDKCKKRIGEYNKYLELLNSSNQPQIEETIKDIKQMIKNAEEDREAIENILRCHDSITETK